MTITAASRHEAWSRIRSRTGYLHGVILADLRASGPATTKALAERTNIPLLTCRPRVTELLQLGLVETQGRADDGAIFAAVSEFQARDNWERARNFQYQPDLF